MYEWLVSCLLLLALAILVSRRGYSHLLGRSLRWGMIGAGAFAGWLIESLPLTPFAAKPSITTALAIVTGLLAARLIARGLTGWARGQQRDVKTGHAPADGRLAHPLIGAGLVILGAPLLYVLVAARHESLEVQETPRDERTLVVLGAEDRRLEGDTAKSHAVLLIHGFLGSPADFGDLPALLQSKGYAVRVLRLPGHGTAPGVLDDVTADEYVDAVDNARIELAARHVKVSVVGLSFGGALALRTAAEDPPYRLVLINPWFGPAATPAWSPVDTNTLMRFGGSTLSRVIRPPGLTRINDPVGLARVRVYHTIRTQASLAAQDLARSAAAPEVAAAALKAPLLLLRTETDHTAPPAVTQDWFRSVGGPSDTRREVVFTKSDHCVTLDYDRDAVAAEILRFLEDGRGGR